MCNFDINQKLWFQSKLIVKIYPKITSKNSKIEFNFTFCFSFYSQIKYILYVNI